MGVREDIIKLAAQLPDGPIHYQQVRPYPVPRRHWWYDMDCSGSPLARRIFTFMEWYNYRRGLG